MVLPQGGPLQSTPICWARFMIQPCMPIFLLILKIGVEGEREGEKHPCVVSSHVPPTGDLARNPGMGPDWESNQRPFGSQACTQSTEPHPGLNFLSIHCPFLVLHRFISFPHYRLKCGKFFLLLFVFSVVTLGGKQPNLVPDRL